jgi:hypothetical protein
MVAVFSGIPPAVTASRLLIPELIRLIAGEATVIQSYLGP